MHEECNLDSRDASAATNSDVPQLHGSITERDHAIHIGPTVLA